MRDLMGGMERFTTWVTLLRTQLEYETGEITGRPGRARAGSKTQKKLSWAEHVRAPVQPA